MRDKCQVEAVCFNVEGKHFVTLPDRIWQRKDLILVAAGAISCVRTLYLRAVQKNRLSQFLPCVTTRADYAGGRMEQKLTACLKQAARPGVRGIILYASCAEVLTQCDWEQAIVAAAIPAEIPVKVLLRGPLVARTRNAEQELEQILSKFPPEEGEIAPGPAVLPVLPPDFAGAASLLQTQSYSPFLLTPGGCTGCIALADSVSAGIRLNHSRFNDLELTLGGEACAVNGITALSQRSGAKSYAMLGSMIPNMIGMDFNSIQTALEKRGISCLTIPCNGFEPAQAGAAQALRAIGEGLTPDRNGKGQISILGYSDLALGGFQSLELGRNALTRRGWQTDIWTPERCADTALHWVVAAEGLPLAEHLKQTCGIPFVCGLPLENAGLAHWLTRCGEALGEHWKTEVPEQKKAPSERRVLLLGQPIVLEGLTWGIQSRWPGIHTQWAMYAPTQTLRTLFQRFCGENDFCFAAKETLKELADEPDLILADPLFFPVLTELFPKADRLACPDPTVSGRRCLPAGWTDPESEFWHSSFS